MSKPTSQPSWIGRTIGGRYQIESVLGQGGMSAVYKATDPNLHRAVAIKLIHPHLSSDPQFVRRFEQEAAAVAQLRHQNIIQVYDFNHDDQIYYMVLEFVPGETLQDELKALSNQGKMYSHKESIRIMATICDAIGYAHDKGMIHRDLKPANVMMNPKGQPILMDFGVAKMLGATQHTATGAIIGTAKYMSPEQARGERPDNRTDLYSLGVMLYEMVAGVPPFEGESTVAILMKHVTEAIPDVRKIKEGVPEGLATVIETALAKDRNNRFQDAAEMAAALRTIDLSTLTSAPLPEPISEDRTILQTQESRIILPPAPVAPVPVSPSPQPQSRPVPPSVEKSGGLPIGLIGVAVVVLLLIGGGIFGLLAMLGGGDSPTATPPVAETPVVVEAEPTQPPASPTPPPAAVVEVVEPTATDTPVAPLPTDTPVLEVTTSVADVLPVPAATNTTAAVSETSAPTETPTNPPPSPTPEAATATAAPAPVAPAGMVFAPAGYFLMGSQTGMPNEQPEHPVLLDGFFIDKFEVTNADYRQCVKAGSCTPQSKKDAFTYIGYSDDAAFDNYPVISVNWEQAKTYCSFVGKRLPTEAEWEYTASGPDNLVYPWGNNFNTTLSAASADDTQAIGSFPGGASPFGAMDMAGNVGEWVADAFNQDFYANSPATNPLGSGGDERIFRGGSFANPDSQYYTTSRRYTNNRTFSEVDIGFRCALNASSAAASPALKDKFCTEVYSPFNPGGTCP